MPDAHDPRQSRPDGLIFASDGRLLSTGPLTAGCSAPNPTPSLVLWEVERVGHVGPELLRTAERVADIRGELRERLVEREYFEAREL
jgi:hypothetical protein